MRQFGALLMMALALAGCDNTLQPLVDGAENNFSLYGYLDTAADTQFVRLDPVRISSVGGRMSLADASVTSVDDQGNRQDWHHTEVTLDDGSVGDLFYSIFRPLPGARYELTATSATGASTRAVVDVPMPPAIDPLPPRGDTLSLMQNVRIVGLDRTPLRLTVLYDVQLPERPGPSVVEVDYGQGNGRTSGGWAFDVFLARDQGTVLFSLDRDVDDRDVALRKIAVRTELLSPEWDEPTAARNLSSGRGFFGAIGRYEITWMLSPSVVDMLGFVNAQ